MTSLPGAIFVVDTKREDIAIHEAQRLKIPIIGLVDTNADPDDVDYVIPANDDAIRSVGLMCRVIADAVIEANLGTSQGTDVPTVVAAEPVVPAVVTQPEPEVCVETESPAAALEAVAEAAPAESDAPAVETAAPAPAAE
jgi:small subunit ribosomal protein S2